MGIFSAKVSNPLEVAFNQLVKVAVVKQRALQNLKDSHGQLQPNDIETSVITKKLVNYLKKAGNTQPDDIKDLLHKCGSYEIFALHRMLKSLLANKNLKLNQSFINLNSAVNDLIEQTNVQTVIVDAWTPSQFSDVLDKLQEIITILNCKEKSKKAFDDARLKDNLLKKEITKSLLDLQELIASNENQIEVYRIWKYKIDNNLTEDQKDNLNLWLRLANREGDNFIDVCIEYARCIQLYHLLELCLPLILNTLLNLKKWQGVFFKPQVVGDKPEVGEDFNADHILDELVKVFDKYTINELEKFDDYFNKIKPHPQKTQCDDSLNDSVDHFSFDGLSSFNESIQEEFRQALVDIFPSNDIRSFCVTNLQAALLHTIKEKKQCSPCESIKRYIEDPTETNNIIDSNLPMLKLNENRGNGPASSESFSNNSSYLPQGNLKLWIDFRLIQTVYNFICKIINKQNGAERNQASPSVGASNSLMYSAKNNRQKDTSNEESDIPRYQSEESPEWSGLSGRLSI